MDAQIHSDITRRLDTFKSAGIIRDYWVSWVGSAGRLDPKVCSWITPDDHADDIREQVISSLEGLVTTDNILVRVET